MRSLGESRPLAISRDRDSVVPITQQQRIRLLPLRRALYNFSAMANDERGLPRDPTPPVGALTDVSPLGRPVAQRAHEQTAAEAPGLTNWQAIAATEKFRELLRAKRRFVVPAMIFFVFYYFALPVSVGYAPRLMARPVLGPVNLAYLFALSQFFMAWIIAWMYVRAAARFDRMAREVLEQERP